MSISIETKINRWRRALKSRKVPALYETDGVKKEDCIIYAYFFLPGSRATWYVLEWDGADTLFCFVKGPIDDELGYVSLRELAGLRLKNIFEVEFEQYFQPTKFSEVI